MIKRVAAGLLFSGSHLLTYWSLFFELVCSFSKSADRLRLHEQREYKWLKNISRKILLPLSAFYRLCQCFLKFAEIKNKIFHI